MSEAGDVRAVVQEAGRIAMRHFGQPHRRWEKGPGQIVTEADIEIDAFLHQALRRTGDAWLSEEVADDGSRHGAARTWVVDPIDGTRSFAEGKPEFAVSVALLVEGRPELGFVYNPARDELFEAAAGGGARLNGARIAVSTVAALEGARIVTSASENRRRNFAALLPSSELTTIGSLAYKLALVACARADGYLSWRRCNDWDIAAAILILEEAGGRMTDRIGQPIVMNAAGTQQQGVLAAPPTLHARILAATLDAALAAYPPG